MMAVECASSDGSVSIVLTSGTAPDGSRLPTGTEVDRSPRTLDLAGWLLRIYSHLLVLIVQSCMP
jgi:hypothetical protein